VATKLFGMGDTAGIMPIVGEGKDAATGITEGALKDTCLGGDPPMKGSVAGDATNGEVAGRLDLMAPGVL